MKLENDPYQKKLSEILTKLYTNKGFLKSVIQNTRKSVQSVKYAFADIIRYYIMSRDENIYENYERICEIIAEFDERRPKLIIEGKLDPNFREKYDKWYNEICEKIDTNGYITHSFYGREGEYIKKYGLNYTKHWNEKEKHEYMEVQQALKRLLEYFNDGTYKVDSYNIIHFKTNRIPTTETQLIYFTTPGDTTFLYTLDGSPTLLYEQLLRRFNDELGDLRGKTKKERIKQILENRAKNLKHIHSDRIEIEEKQKYVKQQASKDIDKVVNYYCDGNQGFALVRIADIRNLNVKLGVGDLKETGNNEYSFDELIAKEEERIIEWKKNRSNNKRMKGNPRKNMYYPTEFFSSDPDTITWSYFENFYAKAEDLDGIPVQCVSCLDSFDIIKIIKEMQQIQPRYEEER